MIMRGVMLVAAVLIISWNGACAWPGMQAGSNTETVQDHISGIRRETYIGPPCTVGAHGDHPESGPCPNMPQPDPPAGSKPPARSHSWNDYFIVDWDMYFVPDDNDSPPYYPHPKTNYNVTRGTTYYHSYGSGDYDRNMRETYYNYCIPVFGDPSSPMGMRNDYSCDFINVGKTKTSYVVTHEDRPAGVPECCIIGRPFHPPPPSFSRNMPVKYRTTENGKEVDWNAVHDKGAGIFNYGFQAETQGVPHAFYMKGVPWVASWLWQPFHKYREEIPSESVWTLPSSCEKAAPCPGWGNTEIAMSRRRSLSNNSETLI